MHKDKNTRVEIKKIPLVFVTFATIWLLFFVQVIQTSFASIIRAVMI